MNTYISSCKYYPRSYLDKLYFSVFNHIINTINCFKTVLRLVLSIIIISLCTYFCYWCILQNIEATVAHGFQHVTGSTSDALLRTA